MFLEFAIDCHIDNKRYCSQIEPVSVECRLYSLVTVDIYITDMIDVGRQSYRGK